MRKSAEAVGLRHVRPRTLIGLAGAAAVLALVLTPLSQGTLRTPRLLLVSSASEPSFEPEPLAASLIANPALRFDLTTGEPTFQNMADRLPAFEGQPSVELRGWAEAPLEPVAQYVSLAPAPPDTSIESMPSSLLGEAIETSVRDEASPPHSAEETGQKDVVTTGSYSDPAAMRLQGQAVDRSVMEPSRSRGPRAAWRSAHGSEPRSAMKPPRPPLPTSRDAGQTPRPTRQAAAMPAAKAGPAPVENRSWRLPRALQPTGL